MSKKIQNFFMMLLVVALCAPQAFGELKALYEFEVNADDSSGNGFHAQMQGNAKIVEDTELVPGIVFNVLEVNGGDDVVVTPGLTDQDMVPTMTFALWIKPEQLGLDEADHLLGHVVVPWVTGTIHFQVSGGTLRCNVKGDPILISGTQLEADKWYHAAVVRDGNDMVFYMDGLEDGRTSMRSEVIFKDGFNIGAHANASRQFHGRMDDVYIYDHALTAEEVLALALAPFPELELSANPSPAYGQINVIRDVELSWTPGSNADQHDVYFGTNFDDVINASATNDPAGVYKGRQEASTYTPGRLEFAQTYYWRVDEIDVDGTEYKGAVWNFDVEPFGYVLSGELITATASSSASLNALPENTINGSGLDESDLHSTESTDMWLSSTVGPQPTWIQYEFDRLYKLYEVWVWNHNTPLELAIGFGTKEATIEYSADGVNWTTLGTHEFARGLGAAGYAHNTTVDLSGVVAKYVKITANNNWGGFVPQFGLSEVRFLYIPVWPGEPNPASGTTDTNVDNVTLSWRPSREAASHEVYLSDSSQAVIDGTALVVSVSEASYDAGELELNKSYYWKIVEVNEAETPTTWQGDVWNFTTKQFLVVDDFEDYSNSSPNRVFQRWIDGIGYSADEFFPVDNPGNGSGAAHGHDIWSYDSPHYDGDIMETAIVHGGAQSAPLYYDNSTANYSEATVNVADLAVGSDWTKHGIKTLTLYFYGDPNNVAQQMYVKINGAKVLYDSDADNITRIPWQAWNIDLADFAGVDLSNVTELSIGFERIGFVGGTGVVYFDDISLTPFDRELVTPAEPDTASLVAYYEFEGTANDNSGNGLNGTAVGDPIFVAGKFGQAISLDGIGDYVEIAGYKGILGPNDFSITAWIKTTADAGALVGWGKNAKGQRVEFRINANRLRCQHGNGAVQGDTNVNDGAWHHVALTVIENATISSSDTILWLDGQDDTRPNTDPDGFNIIVGDDVKIGRRHNTGTWWFTGQFDDIRIYDYALSDAEIAWLSGRTQPFDKPF